MNPSEAKKPGPLAWDRLRAAFWPAPVTVDARERWRAIGGAAIGILFAALISRWLAGPGALGPWLVAPMGASAVLVFCLPASPLAQPWSVIGSGLVSALVGVACARWIPDPAVAAAAAVGGAVALMFALRCLHPPGGAMALLAVLTHSTQFELVAFPVLANSVLLVLAGMAYNSATGRRYPHTQQRSDASLAPANRSHFTPADLDAALAHYNQVLDVPRDDLEALLREAEMAAYRRNLGEIRCADIMTRDPIAVEFGTPLEEAWGLMQRHRIKALPVVDRVRRIVGIITLADFMRHAEVELPLSIGARLRQLVRRAATTHSDKPEVAGQIMTRQVRVASAHRHVVELVPLFSEGGHHHIPIIDGDSRLIGIITQTDLVRALYSAVRVPDAVPA
jgi:CBS domain-containing membrane protein